MCAIRLLVSAATCLALFTGTAGAVETFNLDISGTGVIHASWAGTGPTDPPVQVAVPFNWSGTVTVVTSSGADGTYAGADVLSFSGQGRINDEPPVFVPIPPPPRPPFGDFAGASLFTFDNTWFLPIAPFISPPVVTVANGVVTSIGAAGSPPGPPGLSLRFEDLSVTFLNFPAPAGGQLAFLNISAQGTLTPVPEPETFALMLSGLLGLGEFARRRRSPPADAHQRVVAV
jgi:hypothetical protein